jgi:hypothetical protein|tara:strand:+ start:43319 stop:43654 length:336 start_codon:yes stop_codon:yes gene_type:complete
VAKFNVYQITKTNKTLASQSVFYGISDAFTKNTAKQAFIDGLYTKNAEVEASDNVSLAKLINDNRTSSLILSTGPLRNVSVGDLINNSETEQWFIVGPASYDIIKIKLSKK